MRVFITGALGYIGHAVACTFARRGHSVLGLIRKKEDAHLLVAHEIEPVIGTIADPASYISTAENADVLIHCAFENSKDGVSHDRKTVETFAKLARTWIYTSGCWVYGNSNGKKFNEGTPINPIPLVKWRPPHEEIALASKGNVIRPGCVFGERGGLTAAWFESVKQNKPTLPGTGLQRWPMIHVEDLAYLYLLAAEKELKSIILNAADDSYSTIQENMQALLKSQGNHTPITYLDKDAAKTHFGPLSEGLMVDLLLSSERAQRLLGWKARKTPFALAPDSYYDAWLASQ